MNAMPSALPDIEPLRCAAISKAYEGRPVLSNVSLDIPAGTVLGLVGRNGAGKTTLMRILLGLTEADSGEATVFGTPALRLGDAEKSRLAYVPQQPDAFGWMKVGEMLEFIGGCYRQWDAAFVSASLQRWRLDPRQRLGRLSPGERQRVALIRALALRPDLLVLDEPAAALDPVARRDLLREIALRAADSGTAVLFSTHIVSDLERVASHVAFLHEGGLLFQCAADDLKECFARLVLDKHAVARHPDKLPGELARRPRADGTLAIVVSRQPGADWPAAVTAERARLEVLDLEDLFIEVTE